MKIKVRDYYEVKPRLHLSTAFHHMESREYEKYMEMDLIVCDSEPHFLEGWDGEYLFHETYLKIKENLKNDGKL